MRRPPFTTDRSFFAAYDVTRGEVRPLEWNTREEIVDGILADGFDEIVLVAEFNPAEGWSRDITLEIAEEIGRKSIREEIELRSLAASFCEAKGVDHYATTFNDDPPGTRYGLPMGGQSAGRSL